MYLYKATEEEAEKQKENSKLSVDDSEATNRKRGSQSADNSKNNNGEVKAYSIFDLIQDSKIREGSYIFTFYREIAECSSMN
mmetsp:Transcript_28116/g.42529  ORF Transcript_28116/g.42529 Transcript_28116/m.42529 type:complete len:82 (-) Transcript_28116:214-459(-)|eukprot:CAMPEP_0170510676 /NCGR_PEP_ID=MMETSP0208-20121228/65895_1 /TAXON_ID=197538 /ORGANISM="Strombidium inclinatum, Strain S3" /LENGTH=81 /DNA_ID=CAMNT_0010794161 /DNA_START=1585 /DNA_END=1830 /DNA_ORIENTATION=+